MSTENYAIDGETLLFFDKQPSALSLYECFAAKLYRRFPDTKRRVQKTQITFSNRYVFLESLRLCLHIIPKGVTKGGTSRSVSGGYTRVAFSVGAGSGCS